MMSDGVPDPLARALAGLPMLASAADSVLIADRTGRPVAETAPIYFAAIAYFQLDRIVGGRRRSIKLVDYFDRLAFDRALDSIGDAMRRLAAEMARTGGSGADAVDGLGRAQGMASSACARPSTKSRRRASPSPSSRSPQACWATSHAVFRTPLQS